MIISKYVAQVQLQFDKKSIANVDKQLKAVEAKIRNFGKTGTKKFALDLSNFNVDQRALNMALGNALNLASARSVFTVSRFSVDQGHLNRTMAAAMRTATNLANQGSRLRPNVAPASGQVGRGAASRAARSAGVGGAIGGGLSRLYGPAVALGLGGFGLSQINQRNQQIVSAQLGNTAVVGEKNGAASFDWLKRQGNELGFNWLEQAPEFTGFLGSATPLMGYDKSLETYKAFNEFATTRHADPVARKRALKAIQQMAAKGQVNTEELQNQLGDAANFGELPAVFARAYQEFTGGDKMGAEASKALKEAMKKGQVKSGDILPIVTRMLSEMAAPTLEKSKRSSQSEQGRYQNQVNELYSLASGSGVEEGFARIFRALNSGLSESGSLVRGLANGFNEATKWADDLLLWPQSFSRALEGKDSLVADWLGVEDTKQLREDWSVIKQALTDIMNLPAPSWAPNLESTTKEIKGIIGFGRGVGTWISNASASADIVQADISNRGKTPLGDFFANLGGSLAGASAFISTPFSVDESNQYKDWVAQQYPDGVQSLQNREEIKSIASSNSFEISINVDPVLLSQMDVKLSAEALAQQFQMEIEKTMAQFPNVE